MIKWLKRHLALKGKVVNFIRRLSVVLQKKTGVKMRDQSVKAGLSTVKCIGIIYMSMCYCSEFKQALELS